MGFVGGKGGDHLLLVHGGWGGASTHWGPVLAPLAERFHVIAPDLPGIGDLMQPGLGTIAAYARWLRELLDALDVPSAWCVGNSLGVSIICRFALDFPRRCRGLVFVNGFPMPRTPRVLRWLGERRMGRRIVRTIEKQVAYTPRSVRRAFFDPTKVPREIRDLVQAKSPPQIDAVADVMIEGGGPRGHYPFAPRLVWGEDDHLPGTSKRTAQRIKASWPGSRLAFVPRAGHMPQVENPRVFVDTLVSAIAKP